MDFNVTRIGNRAVFSATTQAGRRCLEKNYSSTKDLVVPADLGHMVQNYLRADRLEVPSVLCDEPQGDPTDQYSTRLTGRGILEASNGYEALVELFSESNASHGTQGGKSEEPV